MYIPDAFRQSDAAQLHDFIQANSFGLLVSNHDGQPMASHLPLLLDRDSGPRGSLIGHMARANPQWQQAPGQQVLAVFSGPHAYISPTWYESEQVVPTWNYVAVHAYGRYQAIDESDRVAGIVAEYVKFYERAMPRPWQMPESSEFIERLSRQIVGFRIEIESFEGKWKLNQNHSQERREKVIRALRNRPDENSHAIADLMADGVRP